MTLYFKIGILRTLVGVCIDVDFLHCAQNYGASPNASQVPVQVPVQSLWKVAML